MELLIAGVQKHMGSKKIIITGGGTGGHLFPALAIGEEINFRNQDIDIHYMGSSFGLEAKVFPIKDVWHTLVPIRGFQRNFSFRSLVLNFLLPFRIIKSVLKVKSFFNEFKPDAIIGTGGYASAIPLFIASKDKREIKIILQEQNSFPGITTRWFAKGSIKIFTAFHDTGKKLNSKNISITGNPIRKNIINGSYSSGISEFEFVQSKRTIFLFGGSQGSQYLNKLLNSISNKIENSGVQIIWQTGDLDYLRYRNKSTKNIKVLPFIDNMANAYALSDLVISRSGALTLSEITACGKPAILIPFSNAAGDHQTKNAESLVKVGAAEMINEKDMNQSKFFHLIMKLIHNKHKLSKMSNASKSLSKSEATKNIVDYIIKELH